MDHEITFSFRSIPHESSLRGIYYYNSDFLAVFSYLVAFLLRFERRIGRRRESSLKIILFRDLAFRLADLFFGSSGGFMPSISSTHILPRFDALRPLT